MNDKPTSGELAVFALLILIMMLAMSGCTPVGAAFDWRDVDGHDPDYNRAGGYSDACGELPGMVGDDC